MNAQDVIMSAKRAFGRGSMMALGAMSGPASRGAAGMAIKSGWKSHGNQIMRNAGIGAGINVGLGLGGALMTGGSYGLGDAFRGAMFGAAMGAGGTAATKMSRKNSGTLNQFMGTMEGHGMHQPMSNPMMAAMRWGSL